MAADLFLLGCTLIFGLAYRFLFRHLPEERWQFVASLPLRKNHDGSWQGLNLTFYGLFTGISGGLGVATFILLTASAGVALGTALLLTLGVLAICLPAAKIIATPMSDTLEGAVPAVCASRLLEHAVLQLLPGDQQNPSWPWLASESLKCLPLKFTFPLRVFFHRADCCYSCSSFSM